MLLDETAVVAGADGLRAQLTPNWEIWGPNGGYLAAVALRAAQTAAPSGHRPASISCQFLSSGKMIETAADVKTIKKGRSTCCLEVALAQGERQLLRAQILTTDRADGPVTKRAAMPVVPMPLSLADYGALHGGDYKPHPFWRNFDVRPVSLPVPTGSEGDPILQMWFKFPGDFAAVDAFADQGRSVIPIDTMMWPTHWRSRATPPDYLAPSIDLSVWFHDVPGNAEWLLLETRADAAGGGLIFGQARMWAEVGRLIATGASHLLHTPRA